MVARKFAFSEKQLAYNTVERLANLYAEQVETMVQLADDSPESSNFDYNLLSEEDLERLFDE